MRSIPVTIAIGLAAFCLADVSSASPTGKVKAHPSSKSHAPHLTPSQIASLRDALKSLRKVQVATEISGLTEEDYQNRLIDAKADVEEDIRDVPQIDTVIHIKKALEAYQDAATAWADRMDYHVWKIAKDTNLDSPRIVRKYKIAVDFESDDAQVVDRDELSRYAHGVITKGCWKVAKDEYEKAEAGLK